MVLPEAKAAKGAGALSLEGALAKAGCVAEEDVGSALCAVTLGLCACQVMEWTPEMKAKALGAAKAGALDAGSGKPSYGESDRWAHAEKLWIGARAKSMSAWPEAGTGFGSDGKPGAGPGRGGEGDGAEREASAACWVRAYVNHYWIGPMTGVRTRVARVIAPFLRKRGKSAMEALEEAGPSLTVVDSGPKPRRP
jgi:hypothetical protein